MKTYFAHSMLHYNSKIEAKVLEFLEKTFGKVICPNRDLGHWQDMKPYLRVVVSCQQLVALGYGKDDSVGRGVHLEVMKALDKKIPVLQIVYPSMRFFRIQSSKVVNEDSWRAHYAKLIVDSEIEIPALRAGAQET
jgi:hypothetical protein